MDLVYIQKSTQSIMYYSINTSALVYCHLIHLFSHNFSSIFYQRSIYHTSSFSLQITNFISSNTRNRNFPKTKTLNLFSCFQLKYAQLNSLLIKISGSHDLIHQKWTSNTIVRVGLHVIISHTKKPNFAPKISTN